MTASKHFIHINSRCRALIVSPFIEELFQERRNDLFLNPIIVNFPWTRAGEKSHASCAAPQRQMHWQTIAANQAAVISDIGQMLEQRWPFRQHIDDQTLILQAAVSIPRSKPIVFIGHTGRRRLLSPHRLIARFRSVPAANRSHRQNRSQVP